MEARGLATGSLDNQSGQRADQVVAASSSAFVLAEFGPGIRSRRSFHSRPLCETVYGRVKRFSRRHSILANCKACALRPGLTGRARAARRLSQQVGDEPEREQRQEQLEERRFDDKADADPKGQGDRQGRGNLGAGAQTPARPPVLQRGSKDAVSPEPPQKPGVPAGKAPGGDEDKHRARDEGQKRADETEENARKSQTGVEDAGGSSRAAGCTAHLSIKP